MSEILQFVPKGYALRPIQKKMLLDVEGSWNTNRVIVLQGDVGVGKSLVLQTIANWRAHHENRVALITPRVALQDQYIESFKNELSLKGSNRYHCKEKGISTCNLRKQLIGSYCKGCPYIKLKNAVIKSNKAIFNLQTFKLLEEVNRDILLIDEAHTLLDQLLNMRELRVWKHKYNYPDKLDNYLDLGVWLDSYADHLTKKIDSTPKEEVKKDYLTQLEKTTNLRSGIQKKFNNLEVSHNREMYHGELKSCLKVQVKTLAGLESFLTSSSVKKIILTSATFNELDLSKLGLKYSAHTRFVYDSPFNVRDRPIIVDFVGNMSYAYQDKYLIPLMDRIIETQEKHNDTKGIVHVTYGLQNKLRKEMIGIPWVKFHDSEDKEAVLKHFKNKEPPGTVLIAAGMGMGIDFAGPEFEWQAIGKIMYPLKTDPVMEYWYKYDSDWITWLAVKELIQACGRINRFKGDKGVTYIWDSCFGNPKTKQRGLYTFADKKKFLTQSFKNRIIWRNKRSVQTN